MRESKLLKAISYVFLPIFIGIMIITILYSFVKDSYKDRKYTYFETAEFESDYIELLSDIARMTIYIDGTPYIEDNGNRIYYMDYVNIYYYNIRLQDNYFLVKYGNKILTNVENLDQVEAIKNYIDEQEGEKLNIINGRLEATSFKRKYKQL